MTRLTPLSLIAALAALVFAAAQGCTSSVGEALELADVGQDCFVNSDCTSPFVCAFQACHAECEASRDCEVGARCVAAARPYKVCQLQAERLCRETSDCAEGLVCGVDGECRDKCERDSDCVEAQRCVSGTCADEIELNDEGMLEPVSGSVSGGEGSPCVDVSDCSGALLCRGQACVPECKADAECGAGRVCQDTRCMPEDATAVACTFTSQCMVEGQLCLAGRCLCPCAEDRDCPSGKLCGTCGCEPDPDAPQACVYNSDCEDPRKICRDRACDCECKKDADCRAGTQCDGCACVDDDAPIDHVVFGSVSIASSFQLALYAGVTRIEGELSISDGSLTDLGDTFAHLEHVGGAIMVTNCDLLERLDFPSLRGVGGIYWTGLPRLKEVDLDGASSPYVFLMALPQLQTLSLSGLGISLLILQDLDKLATLEVPHLTELESLEITGTPRLETLTLPDLVSIGSSLRIGKSDTPPPPKAPPPQPAPSALIAPSLSTIGSKVAPASIRIEGTNLSTLASFGKADWKGVVSSEASIIDNELLGEDEKNAFLGHLLVCPENNVDPLCSE